MGSRAALFLSLLPLRRQTRPKLIGPLKTGCRRPTKWTVMTLTLNSSRFGNIQVREAAVIDFPYGLIGLPKGRYALVRRVDDAGVALPVADPLLFFADYAVDLSDHEAARIKLSESDETAVYVTIRVAGDGETLTANLRAPVLVANGRGYQVINQVPASPLRAPLRRVGAALSRQRSSRCQVRCVPCSSSPDAPVRRSCSATTS
jgi:flagellar assembly factor FliW